MKTEQTLRSQPNTPPDTSPDTPPTHSSDHSGEDTPNRMDRVMGQRQRWALVASLVLTNVLVIGLSVDALLHSRQQYEHNARHLTQNITSALDVNVSKSIEKVDLTLQMVVDELERQLADGGIDEKTSNAFLAVQQQRLPEVEALRVSQADGMVILGKGLIKQERASWVDRDDFIYHRRHADSGLQISKARMGRVAKQYIVGFSRRYNYPDGSFAGTVSAPISVDYFTQLLSQFDVGRHGTLLLRDRDLGLITRVPPLPNNPAGLVGNQVVSDDFRRVFESGAQTATDFTSHSPDGHQRIFTFHRLPSASMVTIVATSTEDYLASWTHEAYRTSAMVGGFLILSVLLGWSQLRLLRQFERYNRKVLEDQIFVNNILDSLGEHVAVINAQGVITAVNASWRRFAADNGAPRDAHAFIGTNYLDICMGASDVQRSKESLAVYNGIRGVLTGTRRDFSLTYPCHSPTEQRWFTLYVMPLMGGNQGAVLIHLNVTDQHRAEARLRASEEHFRMLAENMADIVWKTDSQRRFTYINDADRVIRGFERHEVLGTLASDAFPPGGKALLAEMMEKRHEAEACGQKGKVLNFEIPMRHKRGGVVWVEISTMPSYDSTGNIVSYQGIARDISDRKRRELNLLASRSRLENQLKEAAQEKTMLREQTIRDPLTQVYNRRYLDENLPCELERALGDGSTVAVIMLDLDHFKRINDDYGHASGDEVLKAFAALLKQNARESDIVCRYGGEEFVVIMPRMSVELAVARVEGCRADLQAMTVVCGEHRIKLTMSAGIAACPVHGKTSATLLARADEMLYQSKRNGRNRITVFTCTEGA